MVSPAFAFRTCAWNPNDLSFLLNVAFVIMTEHCGMRYVCSVGLLCDRSHSARHGAGVCALPLDGATLHVTLEAALLSVFAALPFQSDAELGGLRATEISEHVCTIYHVSVV